MEPSQTGGFCDTGGSCRLSRRWSLPRARLPRPPESGGASESTGHRFHREATPGSSKLRKSPLESLVGGLEFPLTYTLHSTSSLNLSRGCGANVIHPRTELGFGAPSPAQWRNSPGNAPRRYSQKLRKPAKLHGHPFQTAPAPIFRFPPLRFHLVGCASSYLLSYQDHLLESIFPAPWNDKNNLLPFFLIEVSRSLLYLITLG